MATSAASGYGGRLSALQQALGSSGVDVAVLAPGPDLDYLLGHSVSSHERLSCLVVPAVGDPTLVLPILERLGWAGTSAEAAAPIVTWADGENPYQLIAGLTDGAQVRRLAVGDDLPARHAVRLQAAFPAASLELAGATLSALRVRKSAAEVASLAAAGAAIDRVQQRIGEWLRVGRTEHDVAADIAAAMLAEGHLRADFVIVGSGPHGASPHHEASSRVIEPGDAVVIDIGGPHRGGPLKGYFSDCTRTYQVAGDPDPDLAAVYELVRRAQQAGVDAVRPGVTAQSVDAAARAVIDDAGYGDYFITRTGHGIGLEVHEDPYLVSGNDTVLEPGMTFSIEPGIYLPGRFGVRIEDIVVVTDNGVRRLNTCPHHHIVI